MHILVAGLRKRIYVLIVNDVHRKEEPDPMDDPRPPRRERERQRHRDEILDAAERLLLQRGVEGTTMEDIARESEFAVGSLYKHFRSKDELVEALVLKHAEEFFDRVEALGADDSRPFNEIFEAFLADYAKAADRSFPFLRLLLTGTRSLPAMDSEAGENLRAAAGRYIQVVAGLVQRGQADGALDADEDAVGMATALVGLIDGAARSAFFRGSDVSAALVLTRRCFLDGFRRR
jgi:AcrR family transcriptional regulator